MSLKDITKEEIETMGYDEIAYIILEEAGKMNSTGQYFIFIPNKAENDDGEAH